MIEKLENNEQVLLMYLADELPYEERIEVEQMFVADAGLRRELERLRDAYVSFNQELSHLDEVSPATASSEFAARAVSREIRRRLARPKVQDPAPQVLADARSWRWLYPTAAAAAILIGAMLWLDRQAAPSPSSGGPYAVNEGLVDPTPARPEPDPYAFFVRSLQTTPDEDVQVVAQANPADSMPQDDLSQLLLDTASGTH